MLRHTLNMISGLLMRRGLVGLSVAVVLVLTGCSSGDSTPEAGASDSPSGSASGSPSDAPSSPATEAPYLPVPDGVELTAQGSELEVGDDAVVAYEPRQSQVGALDITVTRLEKTTFKESFVGWKLDAATKQTNPYFVRASVKNVGDTDLGGRPVPLYIVDGSDTLIESSEFQSTFEPCDGKFFPKRFKTGDKAKVCLVYLSPDKGQLTAVSFRPSPEFDPITWTGDLKSPKADKKPAKGGNQGDSKKQGQQNKKN